MTAVAVYAVAVIDDPDGSPAPCAAAFPFYTPDTLVAGNSVGLLMKQSVMGIGRVIQERMTAHGVTYGQWPALAVLGRGESRTAAELARELQTDAGAMTRMLDRLEEKGFIARSRDPSDRRVILINLTEEGMAAVVPIREVLSEVLNEAMSGFSEEEFGQFRSYLHRLHANVRGMCGGADVQPPPAEE